ncbi:MAG: PP2C family serine/threonine-protein phosphatase, partial [Chloroflexota bacterium]
MTELITGYYFDVGQISKYHDWGAVRDITLKNGDQLNVVSLAGSTANGSQMATMTAVDAVFASLAQAEKSDDVSFTDMLEQAVAAANHAVRGLELDDFSGCSVAVAIVVNGGQLYIAQVGSAGIYFVRKSKLTALSHVHQHETIPFGETNT